MFRDVKAVLFDLDGTIYYGSKIISGANEVINHCKEVGKQVFFLTNNSTKTRRQIYEKLVGMGVACEYDEVITSGYIATLYAQKENMRNIYICGSDNLITEFEKVGVKSANEDEAENLLIGYDPEFDYDKLTKALKVALRAKKIIACNKERSYKGEDAKVMPGCGGMVAPIEWCANRKADYVVGKPNKLMLDIFCEMHGYTEQEILMVGDTYESDILMANKKGCPSVLISDSQYEDTISISNIGEIVHLVK